jgi:hypothetical protein
MYKHFCYVEETIPCSSLTIHCPVAEAEIESGHQSQWKYERVSNIVWACLVIHCTLIHLLSLANVGHFSNHLWSFVGFEILTASFAYCLLHAYPSTMKMRQHVSPECQLTFSGLHSVISHKKDLFIFEVVCHSVIHKLSQLGLFT